MQAGAGALIENPVGSNVPFFESMRKEKIVLLSWFSANRNAPLGESRKLRGVLPCVDVCPVEVNLPVDWSTWKLAMV